MARENEADFEYACSREDCERRFANEHGLAVHLARAHGTSTADEREGERAALEAAERQAEPTDGDGGEDTEDAVPPARQLHCDVDLDQEECDLVAAVSFLFGYADDDEVVCAALADFFDWARADENVVAATKLQQRARAAAAK